MDLKVKRSVLFATFSLFLAMGAQAAPSKDELLTKYAGEWLADPVVIDSVQEANTKHASLVEAGILELDKEWREEVKQGGGKLVDETMSNKLSNFLSAKKKEFGGAVTEIFVMDNKGLNVGQSDPTSDYWQGDEPKFQESFGKGAQGSHLSDIELDESTQSYQVQLSRTITNKAGEGIGAVTIGIIVEK